MHNFALALNAPAHCDHAGAHHDTAELFEHGRPDHEIGDPGLIFERDEQDTLGAARPLPHENQARSIQSGSIAGLHRLGAADNAARGEIRTEERHRMLAQGQPDVAVGPADAAPLSYPGVHVLGGVPIEILYDRMKTAVTGEDDVGHIVYNPSLLALARHYRFQPRACRPYRAKTKGKVERPFSYIRQDFFLGRSFRDLDDLNTQLTDWLDTVANVRTHGTTQRVVAEAFAAEQPELQTLPEHRFDAVLKLERRVSHDGFIAVGGNYYSVPDRTRRVVEVQQLPDLIRVLDLGNIVAEHPVLEGRRQYRIDRTHRTGGNGMRRRSGIAAGITIGRIGDHVPLRPLAIYQAIGSHLATAGRP